MSIFVGSRYLKGFVFAEFSSLEMKLDEENFFLINRVWAIASADSATGCSVLVIFTEVEVVDLGEKGIDVGYLERQKDIYRFPFPKDFKIRKEMLRLARKQIALLLESTSVLYW